MPYLIPDDLDVLEKLVIHLATLYDQGLECVDFDGEVVEDSDYDAMYRKLQKERPDSSAFAEGTTTPGQADAEGDDLVQHNPPMTSIEKADGTLDEKTDIYKRWIADCEKRLGRPIEVVQSYKHDGVACRLYYEKGKLVKAGLRPNRGVKGTNVTLPVQYVKGVPTELPLPLTLAISGELECRHEDFEKVQKAIEEAGEDLRANPRNHTYGAINAGRSDVEETKKGRISFIGYNITGFDDYRKHYKTVRERALWANKTLKVPFVRVEEHQYDDLKTLEDNVKNLKYEVDGVILEVNDLEDREQLGHHGDDPVGKPRGALAWKFEEERAFPTVDHLEWNASRTGKVTPVAVFQTAVKLAGTDVQRATCSNVGWAERMGIGAGSVVKVYKAGKIIPKVEELISGKVAKVDHPTHCPACDSVLVVEIGNDNNKELLCKNADCAPSISVALPFPQNDRGEGPGRV